MRTVGRLNVTPVKGTRLHHPDRVELTAAGIPENRRFFLIDAHGRLYSGPDHGPLVGIHAEHDPATGRLELRFPEGGAVTGDTDAAGEAVVTDFYGRPVPGHVVDGPFADALSCFVGRDVRLVRADHDGDGPDMEPLTIVSLASVRDLAAHGRFDGELDSRRFRINIEVAGCQPFEEDSWQGRDVRVGGAEVRITGQIPRCVVTTQDPDTGVKDWDTLTQIARYRLRIGGRGGLPFGMYARVTRPGSVAVGDAVEPLGRPEGSQITRS
jgi:uncharacterized protein YcbX